MAAMSSHLLLSTLCYCCLCCLLSSVHVPRAASLTFSFNFSDPGSDCTSPTAELACDGDAYLHGPEKAIELTKNDISDSNYHSVGRVRYAQPVPLWDAATGEVASFRTSFAFRIKPTDPERRGSSADGMAFFLRHPYLSGVPPRSHGGNLGLFNDSNHFDATGDDRVVAVEFDTYKNDEWDKDGNHVGINVNSIRSKATISPNDQHDDMTSGEVMAADVGYDNGTEVLSVTLWVGATPYRVSAAVDMRRSLPSEVAVGFSAATGGVVEVHRLLSWSFTSTLAPEDAAIMAPGEAPGAVPSAAISSERPTKSHATIAVSVATLFVVICAVMGFLLRRRLRTWKKPKGTSNAELEDEDEGDGEHYEAELGKGVGPRRFPYKELAAATGNFSEEMKLGKGGFGHVYQGCLMIDGEDRHVAIKRFSPESSAQGRKEFEAEVKIISRLRHRNLVQLIGWCDGCKGLLIVYELVSEGSLDKHIYNSARVLTWPERYKIIVGLGAALRYLHAEWEQCVVHGDIKPSNIMLDASRDAKLGDFGLARLVDHGARAVTTKVVKGTAGYIDPELVNTCRPSAESDVYSFGVVLLELVTGHRPVEEPDDSEELFVLVRWVWRLYSRGAVLEAVDERLRPGGGDGEPDGVEARRQMERALVVGLWCAQPDRGDRPSIAQAMHVLQSDDAKLPALRTQMYGAEPFLAMGGESCSDLLIEMIIGSDSTTTTGSTARSEEMRRQKEEIVDTV
ncbi:hypothetical protein ACP70R_006561 [Stipagrostis hirtigluma subsp. patula]